MANHSLAEKPKVGELQMDWLRSEDLKEEKNISYSQLPSTVGALGAQPLVQERESNVLGA
jgi:hypothetical protein